MDSTSTCGASACGDRPLRVLYSFPHRLGADRICTTAWHQVAGLARAGAAVTVHANSLKRAAPAGVSVWPTLAAGPFRAPFALLGSRRAFALHDQIVARRLRRLAGQVDIVHAWPSGSLRTLQVARELGIPSVLERPNAHTRYAYEVVRDECDRLGVALPPDHEHAWNDAILQQEEAEFAAADRLLCPSDFVVRTFVERGFDPARLARHSYGYDEMDYHAPHRRDGPQAGLNVLFVGACAVRKGLHLALQAWLASTACKTGRFDIAGEFLPAYRDKLAAQLAHPSVAVLGHRRDVAALMRENDLLVLPSLEEGSALVTYEARASGCVLLVSDAAGATCRHLDDALVHPVGDVAALTAQIDRLDSDRGWLDQLRRASLARAPDLTWTAAGRRLLAVYRDTLASCPSHSGA